MTPTSPAPGEPVSALHLIDQWLHVPTLKLRAGEMSAQEQRTVIAVLRSIRTGLAALAADDKRRVAGTRYDTLDEVRRLLLGESTGWLEVRHGDTDNRISDALQGASDKVRDLMFAALPAPVTQATYAEPEPPLVASGGRLSIAWAKWYRAQNGCDLLEARAAGERRLLQAKSPAAQQPTTGA